MLAEKEMITPCPTAADDADKPASENGEVAAPKGKARRVPGHVRRLATEAAKRHGMTLGEFLAEAILAYAERLDDSGKPRIQVPADTAETLKKCEERIKALEARVRTLETTGRRERFFARVRLENLVERPWMRNRGY